MSDFGTELARLMQARGIGVRELHRRSGYSAAYISQLRHGRRLPSPEAARDLDDALSADGALAAGVSGVGRRDLLKASLAASGSGVLDRVLDGAAADAMEFTRLTGVSAVGMGVLEHVDAVISRLDRAYSSELPGELFPLAHGYRARVGKLTAGPCTLREKRELYVQAAWLSELLAWLSHDLGASSRGRGIRHRRLRACRPSGARRAMCLVRRRDVLDRHLHRQAGPRGRGGAQGDYSRAKRSSTCNKAPCSGGAGICTAWPVPRILLCLARRLRQGQEVRRAGGRSTRVRACG
jgi:transcriptional regulator with XRE-family HTH domain